ncbi:hypothetical protein PTKIN_Ptkin13bG0102700 [Pterospermum kingtungense]
MQRKGISPSGFTFSSVLNACARVPAILEGKQVHARVEKSGLLGNYVVQTALLDMYSKCGFVMDAQRVFNAMEEKDVVAWTAMICGYTKVGLMDKARSLFEAMEGRNMVSWTAMVAGYANYGDMKAAKELYDRMVEKNPVAWLAMIAGYGKCGDMSEARRVFDGIVKPNASCWAAMVACYAQNGYAEEAIDFFKAMRDQGVRITEVALVGALSACTQIRDVNMAEALAKNLEEGCCNRTLFVSNALIHMHARCGCMEQAWREFSRMKEKDVISYSTMITGVADHGESLEALALFAKMHKEGIKPNQVTFVGVLNACSHGGLVEEGCKFFELMTQILGIPSLSEHISCMVYLLGRAGHLEKAYNIIIEYGDVSDSGIWGALLGACKVYGNAALGEIAAGYLFEIEPEDVGNYVLLANIYASLNRWEDAERLRKMISEKEKRKSPGCSWLSSLEKQNKEPELCANPPSSSSLSHGEDIDQKGSSAQLNLTPYSASSFSYKKRVENVGAATECVVCLLGFEDGEEVRQLHRCKHSFHAPCIDMWMYSHSNCPICRTPVDPQAADQC